MDPKWKLLHQLCISVAVRSFMLKLFERVLLYDRKTLSKFRSKN